MSPLSLFPLPTVLFPGATEPYFIFEPRYRAMIEDVSGVGGRFGILYHDPDVHGPFLNEPGSVGTVAEITHVAPADGGRSWIMVRGAGRFRIDEEVRRGRPYYEARVRPLLDRPVAGLEARREGSLALYRRLAEVYGAGSAAAGQIDGTREVSFALARSVSVDPEWQQALIELDREDHRLDRIDAVFHAAIAKGTGGQ